MKPFNEHGEHKPKELKTGEYGLHGDVILFRDDLPKDFEAMPIVKDSCLAYGEATGHAHKIFGDEGDFSLRECPKTKTRFLHVVREVMLKHQEHEKVKLPPGDYRIDIQKEYDPFEKLTKRVID